MAERSVTSIARSNLCRIVNDIRLDYGDGRGTIGEVADRIEEQVVRPRVNDAIQLIDDAGKIDPEKAYALALMDAYDKGAVDALRKVLGPDAVAAAAAESAKHIAYYQTRYDGKGGVKWLDDGGMHCACYENDGEGWSAPPDGNYRPWTKWHEHVQTAALRAAVTAVREEQDKHEVTITRTTGWKVEQA